MKILAIETTGKFSSIAILDTEIDRVFEKAIPSENQISEILTDEIRSLLEEARTDVKELELIAVGIGPGSYTGTRIGIATAKGLAQGLDIPIVGVNSFSSLIEAIDENYEDEEIIPLIDAKNNRVYYQIGEEQGCDDVEKVLEKLKDENYIFTGSGAVSNKEIILKELGSQATIDEQTEINAKFIAQIAAGLAQNNLYDDIVGLKPLYISQPNI